MGIGKRILLLGVVLLAACDKGPQPETALPTATPRVSPAASQWLQAQDQRLLSEVQQHGQLLLINIQQLLAEPSATHLEAARHSFLELYQHFHESRAAVQCRNLQVPELRSVIARLDPLPILPGFVDSLALWPDSGLVNDDTLPITQESLLDEQGAGLAEETSLGLQVIGFLLDGDPAAPHQLEHFDTRLHNLQDTSHATTERRRSYLLLASQQWLHDFASVRDASVDFSTGRDCPLAALRLAVDQQLTINALNNLDDVQDSYFPTRYRELALKGGSQGLARYFAQENPWQTWMQEQPTTSAIFEEVLAAWAQLTKEESAENWQAFNELLNRL